MVCRTRWIGLLLALAFATGCFAFEEIDDGMARWSRNSEATSSDTTPEAPQPASAQRRQRGWERVRSVGSESITPDIVGCMLDGRSQYMRESECVARGGRVTS
jgi:hypothetical protein